MKISKLITLLLLLFKIEESLAVMQELDPASLSGSQVNISPKIVDGNKSPTTNGRGYVYFSISPIGEEFIKNEAKRTKTLLDIGSGYSNVVIDALKEGVKSYTAVDMSQEHLKILVSRIQQTFGPEARDKLKHLKLLVAKAPDELPEVSQQYDAILADKVLHFMTPVEIVQFIGWAKKALKKGGKIYVVTASPYSKSYHKILPEYLARLAKGDLFPGHFTNIMQSIDTSVMKNYPDYLVPDEMVLFSRLDLVNLFKREGMKVINSYSLKIPTETETHWPEAADDESNVVGIIAVNP